MRFRRGQERANDMTDPFLPTEATMTEIPESKKEVAGTPDLSQ